MPHFKTFITLLSALTLVLGILFLFLLFHGNSGNTDSNSMKSPAYESMFAPPAVSPEEEATAVSQDNSATVTPLGTDLNMEFPTIE